MSVGVQTVKWYQEAEKISKPYITRCLTDSKKNSVKSHLFSARYPGANRLGTKEGNSFVLGRNMLRKTTVTS